MEHCYQCHKALDLKNDEGDYRYWPEDKENPFCNDCLASQEVS